MDPRTRVLLLAQVGVLAVVLERPTSLAVLATWSVAPLLLAPIGRSWRLRAVAGAAAIVWGTVLSQGLFYADLPRVAAVRLGPVVLWAEGIRHGLVQSLRLVAVASAGLALVATTPLDRLLAALRRLKVPYALAFLAITGLRFAPEVGRELLIVRRARARRGRPTHKRSPWAWIRLEISLLRPIIARTVRRAHRLAESLDVRGFDPEAPRAIRTPLKMKVWELPLLLATGTATLAALAARGLYLAYVSEAWYLPALRPLYGFVRSWL